MTSSTNLVRSSSESLVTSLATAGMMQPDTPSSMLRSMSRSRDGKSIRSSSVHGVWMIGTTPELEGMRSCQSPVRPSCTLATSTAKRINVSSEPRAPINDRPTGRPSTFARGRLICGHPVIPPMHVRRPIRTPSSCRSGTGISGRGAGAGDDGIQMIAPSPSRSFTLLLTSWRTALLAAT